MMGYAETDVFTSEELHVYKRAASLIGYVPNDFKGKVIRCHELVRAFSLVLSLPVQDGRYCYIEHSWLWVRNPGPELHKWILPPILDVYVPGRLPQVQLLDVKATALPMDYRPGPERTDIDQAMVDFIAKAIGYEVPLEKTG